ncbi:MAG: class I mannose-6-phosphate isomerase [Actinomycetota bacterium]|nr:class I mannose-6-phosphate isomerase [Actinomycetota bacterium]
MTTKQTVDPYASGVDSTSGGIPSAAASPVSMPPNLLTHYYRGGSRLASFRGIEPTSAYQPEDWLASTVHRYGDPASGPSRLADGTLFADLIAADPVGWLGATGAGPNGPADTGILVKLLDADQRLPVHVHPSRPFAVDQLHSCYGKSEAWYVIATDGDDPCVWVGLRDDVDEGALRTAVDRQDSEWLLGQLNRVQVQPGDAIFVPAGRAHAIGPGVLVIEVQEPTDFSVILEWAITTSGPESADLGLGIDTALRTVNLQALDGQALAALHRHTDSATESAEPLSLLPGSADEFFTMQLLATSTHRSVSPTAAAGFAVVVVIGGTGTMSGAAGSVPVSAGQVFAVPAAFGQWQPAGDVQLVVCRPGPAPAPLPALPALPASGRPR